MRAPWIEQRRQSLLGRLALAPLLPVEALYAAGARLHRAAHASGVRSQTHLPCKVLSVGNLVVGGSGKTPTVAWIVRGLLDRGFRVAVASRGYARRETSPVVVVSDGETLLANLAEAGDEPTLLAQLAAGVPILVGPDRAEVGRVAVERFDTEVLVLDDGFQHHRLARDLDLLTFDGSFGLGNRHVLPRGPLREALSVLGRVDGILVIDGPLPEEDEALLRELAPGAGRFAARRKQLRLSRVDDGEALPISAIEGASVGLLTGLANPASFRRSVEGLGALVIAERLFPDHHDYSEQDLRGLERIAPLWLTTEKDAVKIRPHWSGAGCLRAVGMELEVEEPDRLLDWLEAALR